MTKKAALILSHGDKGGVGKSFALCTYIDRQLSRGETLIAVEADRRNPDVARRYGQQIRVEMFDISKADSGGWMDLASMMDENPGVDIAVSLPAQIGHVLTERRDAIAGELDQLGRRLGVFWALNRDADSINLLRLFLDDFESFGPAVLAIKNGYFGTTDQYYRWEKSKTRERLLAYGAETYLAPLHERVIDRINGPFATGMETGTDTALPYGERAELERWRAAVHRAFDPFDVLMGR